MLNIRKATAAFSGLGLIVIGSVAPAVATAETESAPMILAQAADAASFDDEKIKAFVTANAAVQDVRTTYMDRLATIENEDERVAVAQQANESMVKAVDETPDISVEEYTAIISAAEADPAFAERLNEAIADGGA